MSPSDLPKLWTEPTKIGHIFWKWRTSKINLSKKYFNKSQSPSLSPHRNCFWKDSANFQHWKMTLKTRILKCSWRIFLIFLSLTMTLFSEKIHCKPIPIMKTGISLCSISSREKPVFINWEPCNENRLLPVRKTSQGKPCFHYRDGFAVHDKIFVIFIIS